MAADSRKLQFALDNDEDGPPVSSEAVWCDLEGTAFKLRNAPFFIKGLAVNDVFEAELDAVNGHIFEFTVIEPSNHSLVWLLNNTEADIGPVLAKFRELGCSTEGLEELSLYAIDIPGETPDAPLNLLLDAVELAGFDLAFPVWRRA